MDVDEEDCSTLRSDLPERCSEAGWDGSEAEGREEDTASSLDETGELVVEVTSAAEAAAAEESEAVGDTSIEAELPSTGAIAAVMMGKRREGRRASSE